jgi:hypothetical protein
VHPEIDASEVFEVGTESTPFAVRSFNADHDFCPLVEKSRGVLHRSSKRSYSRCKRADPVGAKVDRPDSNGVRAIGNVKNRHSFAMPQHALPRV